MSGVEVEWGNGQKRVVIDPEIQHGKLVIRGSRVPITRIVGGLAGGVANEACSAYGSRSGSGHRLGNQRPCTEARPRAKLQLSMTGARQATQPREYLMQPRRKRHKPYRLVALAFLLVTTDQVVKAIVRTTLTPGESVPLLDDVLRVTFVPNFRGFSWWVPPFPTWANLVFQILLILVVLAAFPVYLFHTHTRRQSIWADIAVVGISASGLGHLMDGVFVPYTTDFIQVFNSPCANLADVCSYVGIGALVVETLSVFRIRKPKWRGFHHLLAVEVRIWKDFFEFIRKAIRSSK